MIGKENDVDPKVILYCPAEVRLFSGTTLQDLYGSDVFDEEDLWDAGLVKDLSEEWIGVLMSEMRKYSGGKLHLDLTDSSYAQDQIEGMETSLTAAGGHLWLRMECCVKQALNEEEFQSFQEALADLINAQAGDVAQWGWMDTKDGALLLTFEPQEHDDDGTACWQPSGLRGENHLLTARELELQLEASERTLKATRQEGMKMDG